MGKCCGLGRNVRSVVWGKTRRILLYIKGTSKKIKGFEDILWDDLKTLENR